MAIPTHQQWMNDTGLGIMKPRSTPLKDLDAAIELYGRVKTQDSLFKIRNCFEAWKRLTMGGATQFQFGGNRFTPQELRALQFVAQERKKSIERLFAGKEVRFRNSPRKIKQTVEEAAQKVQSTCKDAKDFLTGQGKKSTLSTGDIAKQKLEAMAKSFFQVDTLETLGSMGSFVIDIIGKAGVSVAPVVGHIKDGYDLFVGWAKAGAALHEQHSISERRYVIETGAPTAAFDGLKTCLANETKNEASAAGIATTSFALKTGLAFVDGGFSHPAMAAEA